MTRDATITDPVTLTVQVPLTFQRRGGRKLVIAPNGSESLASPRLRIDNTMIKAIARAHRWKRMLENADFATIHDLATAERINPSYVSRILRLTLLAPEFIEAILDGRQSAGMQLDQLLKPFPVEWELQTQRLGLMA